MLAQFSRTWWGKRFIEALEEFTDSARAGRFQWWERIQNCYKITATVNQSTYFGVYKEPRYKTTIEITPIAKLSWSKAIKYISSKASFVSKLLMNEVPDNIESADLGLHLLQSKDFKQAAAQIGRIL